ncbi:uncharacterized protein LOC110049799 [Orbicella faveolata]|uniref:uncharacterized protein LOC110049799 n=1 Tax=Orbicella faveolata TaxID=48498 RepID=UPI0009E593CF|nr:uncharacterized protein LOC110049799 [Orbicella faveolata]
MKAKRKLSQCGSEPALEQASVNLRIDVFATKPTEHNTQDRTPVSTTESVGSNDGEHNETSAVPVPSEYTCMQTENEARQASTEEVLRLIAYRYLDATPPSNKDEFNSFLAYMKEMRLVITGVSIGSLLITVKCDSLQILESLWEDYLSGRLGEVVQRCFVTEEILTELSLEELQLKTTISEEEYKACKMFLGEDSAKEADETDDDDSASDDEGT